MAGADSKAAVKTAHANLAAVRKFYAGRNEGSEVIAGAERQLEAAKVLNGKTPTDGLKATEHRIVAKKRKRQALVDELQDYRDQIDVLHEKQSTAECSIEEVDRELAADEQEAEAYWAEKERKDPAATEKEN